MKLTDLEFKIFWSIEDLQWIAICKQFPSLSYLDKFSPKKALQYLIDIIYEEGLLE